MLLMRISISISFKRLKLRIKRCLEFRCYIRNYTFKINIVIGLSDYDNIQCVLIRSALRSYLYEYIRIHIRIYYLVDVCFCKLSNA